MSGNWKIPVESTVTCVYCDALEEGNVAKPKAFDTTFRYSGVHGCSRARAYEAAGYEPTDPMTGPDLAIAAIGEEEHKKKQLAYQAKYPEAQIEVPSQIDDLISGSADIVHDDTVIEMKNPAPYGFDKAAGIDRGGYSSRGWVKPCLKPPEGPDVSYICQAGMNARGLGLPKVRIVCDSRVAVPVDKAEPLGLKTIQRFNAEWEIPQDVWGPLVDHELGRLATIRNWVNQGKLPPRYFPDGDNNRLLEPEAMKFPCTYCPYRTTCLHDGPGAIPLREKEAAS